MKKKVCIVAPVHPWNDVRVFKKQAVSLSESGYDVTVIARATSTFTYGDIKIEPAKGTYKTRTQRFLSIPKVALQARKYNADIYHLHNPDTIPIAFLLKLLGKVVIYDTHEDFSERLLARSWIPKKLRRVVAKSVSLAEIYTANLCDASIATQEDIVSRFGEKCILLGNAPRVTKDLLDNVSNLAKSVERNTTGTFRLVYIGGISETRGIYEMIDSLVIVNNSFDCRLWLIGPITEELLNSITNREGWKFVDFIAQLPQEQALAYVSLSDVGLVYINDIADHRKSDANKIYEYMTFNKPFIASDFPVWRKKLSSARAGYFVESDNTNKLANAICEIHSLPDEERADMGNRGKKYAISHSWEKDFIKLLRLYQTVETIND